MIKPLLWKEWHEQRWKLVFGTAMLVFFTGSLLAARLTTEREIIIVVWVLCGLVLSLYSAMGVFAPEITTVIDAKATWTVGKGFKADEETMLLLDTIKGFVLLQQLHFVPLVNHRIR